jgi:multiple antibiotic resistance protein
MELLSAIVTLFLVMDPIGNVPVFSTYLQDVDEHRRTPVVARESVIALMILMFFLFFGPLLREILHIEQPAIQISGGVLLFLIALDMIFPGATRTVTHLDRTTAGEPFIVPLATPLLAGPSSIATIMIFASRQPARLWLWLIALVAAWVVVATILLVSPALARRLGARGLTACERLMGMVLTVIAVQMFLDGLAVFLASQHN